MALSVDEFSKRYQRSGVSEPGPLPSMQRILSAYRKSHAGQLPGDGESLCDWLVQKGILTAYQVEQLLGTEAPELYLGDFVKRRKLESAPWSGWWMALGAGGAARLVFPVSQPLEESTRERMRRVANLGSEHLLACEEQSDKDGGELIVCAAPSGRSLAELAGERTMSSRELLSVAVQLADTLQQLHARGLWGAFGDPQRIFVEDSGNVVALWDPTHEPGAHSGGWFASEQPPWVFLPPECMLHQQPYDAAADIYGLGCLIYYMKFREFPYPLPKDWLANPIAVLEDFKQQVRSLPHNLREQAESLGTPEDAAINRVLAHCLARNRDARFASANQVLLAFSAIQTPDMASGKVDKEARPVAPSEASQRSSDAKRPSDAKGATATDLQKPKVASKSSGDSKKSADSQLKDESESVPSEPIPAVEKQVTDDTRRDKPLAGTRQTAANDMTLVPQKDKRPTHSNPKSTLGAQAPSTAAPSTAAPSTVAPSAAKSKAASTPTAKPTPPAKEQPPSAKSKESVDNGVPSSGHAATKPSKKPEQSSSAAAGSPVTSVVPAPEKQLPGEGVSQPDSKKSEATLPEVQEPRVSLQKKESSGETENQVVDSTPTKKESSQETTKVATASGAAESPAPLPEVELKSKVRLPESQERKSPKRAVKSLKKKKKKNQYAPYVLGGMGLVVIALLIAVLVSPGGGDSGQAQREVVTVPGTPPPVRVPTSESRSDRDSEGERLLTDDPRALWATPNQSAEPLALSMLPSGADLYVSFRPDRLLESGSAGEMLRRALSPELDEALQAIESRIGVGLDEVKRVTLGVEGAGDAALRASICVELLSASSRDELATRWEADEANLPGGTKAYVGEDLEGDVYFIDPQQDEAVTRFAVGDVEAIKEIAALEGGPVTLTRAKSQLWACVGPDPDFALMGVPNFLFADGRKIVGEYASTFVDPLKRFLIPDVSDYVVRMDFQPQWYVEMRVAPGGGITPDRLRAKVEETVQTLPLAAEKFLIDSSPHPSWKGLAIRLPAMTRAVVDSSRFGIVDGNPTVNFYLPAQAAPNLLLATWLASNTPQNAGSGGAVTVSPGEMANAEPLDLQSLLAKTFSISFGQESLEMAAQAIADQFNSSLPASESKLEIVLLGGDLQLDGITQNQQIRDFDHRNATLTTVLDDLVRRANPNRTATELYQDAQQLIWVIGPHPERPDSEVILITTRTQAKKKYTIPSQFLPPQP